MTGESGSFLLRELELRGLVAGEGLGMMMALEMLGLDVAVVLGLGSFLTWIWSE